MLIYNVVHMAKDMAKKLKKSCAERKVKKESSKVTEDKRLKKLDQDPGELMRRINNSEKWQGLRLKQNKSKKNKSKMLSAIAEIPEVGTIDEAGSSKGS